MEQKSINIFLNVFLKCFKRSTISFSWLWSYFLPDGFVVDGVGTGVGWDFDMAKEHEVNAF